MADYRHFAKLDVGYFDNPKTTDLMDDQPRALILHLRAIVYCRQHLLDGSFPVRQVVRLACASYCGSYCESQCDVCVLVECGLFERVDDRFYAVHDYLKHQDSGAQVAKRKAAGQSAAAKRWGANGNAVGTPDSTADATADANAEKRREEKRRDRGTQSRATRIPADFAVTDDMRTFVAEKGWGHLDLEAITEEFVDYWTSASGKTASRADWVATWRNWIRRKAGDSNVRPLRATATGTESSLWERKFVEPTDD